MSRRGHPSQIRRYRALHPGQLSARSSRRCIFTHGNFPPCQVEVTPRKSEGIEPFTLVNSLPGQVEDVSLHPINSPSGQVRVTPRKSEGIEPFTLVNSLPGQVEVSSSHPINTPLGQVEDASSHTVNSPPCQVRVIPHKSEGIEPSTLVNSPPGHVGATPSHPINTPLVPHEVASSVSSQVPLSLSSSVAPVSPLMSSTSVLVPITDRFPPVTSPLCPLTPDPSSTSLETTQAMSHKQPVDLHI